MIGTSWTHLLARQMVRALLGTRVRPNHLTTLRLVSGIAACLCFAPGTNSGMNWGGLLWLVSALLDRAVGELAQRVDDVGIGKRADEGERDSAAQAGLQSAHRLAAVLECGERRLGVRPEGTAGLGEAGVAADAFEHRRTEFVFQEREAATDGGLGTMQAPGGAGEAAEFGDGDEGLDRGDVHRSGFLMLMQSTMHLTDARGRRKSAAGAAGGAA